MAMRKGFVVVLSSGLLFVLAALPLSALIDPEPEAPLAPPRAPRRIVVCLDGTWNSTYDESIRDDGSKVLKPTNVLKLCRSVLPRNPDDQREQIAYYATGVGSLAEYPGPSNHLLHTVDKLLGGAYGAGFEANIEEALNFLVLNYEQGDEVFIFGFSRGAATARGVTRFLDWAHGLPIKSDAYYLPVLYRAFVISKGQRTSEDVLAEINQKRANEKNRAGEPRPKPPLNPLRAIDVRYLGVWDTVMALGARFQAKGASTSTVSKSFFVDRQPAPCVRHARQALAIDEARFDFRPEIWTGHAEGQTLEQQWFAGVHSNVGGGYPDDGLANIAFQWILAGAAEQGLAVDRGFSRIYGAYPQDRLYDSGSTLYRILDKLRSGRGARPLVGQPATANLSLAPSVIRRIQADPKEPLKNGKPGELRFPEMKGKPYRPDNVLLFLACQPDLDGYLKELLPKDEKPWLPDDAMKRIKELRPQCGKPGNP
jgi:uncharacterized protein (DUF2235 family)